MIKIGILGDIGSGKSFIAKHFGYPVFNADEEVGKLYKEDIKIFNKLKKRLPKHFTKFPISKREVSKAILANNSNLKKIVKIIHRKIRDKLRIFLKRNKNRGIVILDVPLLLENRINKKNDILVFVQSNKLEVLKRLKKRKNFNYNLYLKFKKIQLPLEFKKKNSNFVIKNDFKKKTIRKHVNIILKEILQ